MKLRGAADDSDVADDPNDTILPFFVGLEKRCSPIGQFWSRRIGELMLLSSSRPTYRSDRVQEVPLSSMTVFTLDDCRVTNNYTAAVTVNVIGVEAVCKLQVPLLERYFGLQVAPDSGTLRLLVHVQFCHTGGRDDRHCVFGNVSWFRFDGGDCAHAVIKDRLFVVRLLLLHLIFAVFLLDHLRLLLLQLCKNKRLNRHIPTKRTEVVCGGHSVWGDGLWGKGKSEGDTTIWGHN